MGLRWRQTTARLGRALVALAAVLAAAACDGPTEFCAAVGRPALAVAVADSLTGAPAAAGATLVARARGGAPADSSTGERDDQVLYGGGEGAGVYEVMVRKAGYREWRRPAVEVEASGECRAVQTVHLTARLARP
jgi:hypothetical protein